MRGCGLALTILATLGACSNTSEAEGTNGTRTNTAVSSATEPNPLGEEEEFYPADFRGSWAPSLTACKSDSGEAIQVGRTKIWAYEADSKLLKMTPIASFSAPDGAAAKSFQAIVAERAEDELGVAKIRLTLSGGRLYMSNASEPEAKQWDTPYVKCPES